MLSAQNLTYSHGDKPALFEVCATFRPGKLSVILGPNGAGKSTLLACLAGLKRPQDGRALLGDLSVADMPARTRARAIGLLPQGAETHWAINAEALVALGRYPHQHGIGLSPIDFKAIDAAMAATTTTEFAARRVTELSGGERARVLMARILAGQPKWILADEPLANLDPGYQIDMLDLLRQQAARGVGVIAVLHDLHHAARFADDILLLQQGRVFAHGDPGQVLTKATLGTVYGIDASVTPGEEGIMQLSIKGRIAQ